MSKKTVIGLLGLGTVGSGTLKVLNKFDNIIIKNIAVRDTNKKRNIEGLDNNILTTDAEMLVNDPDIDIIVEVMGGLHPAFELIKKALQNGKHIVTANKDLIAKHGEDLFSLAKENNVVIMYEAAVAGGIPILMPLRQSLSGNSITKIAGIMNGTTNYILTKMESEGSEFNAVLKEAQELGYAESDPSGDVQGHDAANKISILASLAFNKKVDVDKIYREGIDYISPIDISYASEFGYNIKLIALAQETKDKALDIRVHPMLISKKHPLAHINDVMNAIVVEGDAVGQVMFSGPGAGEMPTASSVTGDVLSIASELGINEYPLPMMRNNHSTNAVQLKIDDSRSRYYIRVNTDNLPGVIGDLGLTCGRKGINLCSIIQKGLLPDGTARIVLLTALAYEKDIQEALKEMYQKRTMKRVENVIRVMD
ncbi:MAG: homoserine dehydrogenase [Candidatus Gastranaerophilales bacterium]|nr:homoserine dehydrogenase [Candidatus Gastranaerophilales bacterium]